MKWVGTTEAAALLRQFGIRARIVDFKGQEITRMLAHLMLYSNASAWQDDAVKKMPQGA